jgi:hypothetical protein
LKNSTPKMKKKKQQRLKSVNKHGPQAYGNWACTSLNTVFFLCTMNELYTVAMSSESNSMSTHCASLAYTSSSPMFTSVLDISTFVTQAQPHIWIKTYDMYTPRWLKIAFKISAFCSPSRMIIYLGGLRSRAILNVGDCSRKIRAIIPGSERRPVCVTVCQKNWK